MQRISLMMVFLVGLLLRAGEGSTALPTPYQPDSTYQTGIVVVVTSQLKNTLTYTISYNWAMSTSSLNTSLGIVGIDFQTSQQKHGFDLSVMSLNKSALIICLNVYNSNTPVNYLRLSFLVSYNPFFDIGFVEYTFDNTYTVSNYSLAKDTCHLDCRSYIATVYYLPKSGAKAITVLSGYRVKSVGLPATWLDSYLGVNIAPLSYSSTYFKVNITVYGGTEVSYISFFYVSFEYSIINADINTRHLMYRRGAIGCALEPNWCGNSSSVSNTTFRTDYFYVVMNDPYSKQMVFYGMDRVIAQWTNSSSTKVGFDLDSLTSVDHRLDVAFSWTGNPSLIFTLAFSTMSLQTYYCPDTSLNKYYYLNSYVCTDACNLWISQYANASRYCQLCDALCYKCTGTPSACTACYSSQNRVLSGSSCICDVGGGFYDDGSSVVCPPCNYTCKTCSGSGAGNCLSCQPTMERVFASSSCPCTVGHFDNGTATCLACYYTCSTGTCNYTWSTRCKSCNATRHRQLLGNFTCSCMDGYYDNSTNSETCAACHYSCQACWATNTFCTACDSSKMRNLDSVANICPCDPGYYDPGAPTCVVCHPTCFTCNGGTASHCQSCQPASLRAISGTQCLCPSSYYDESNVCQQCHFSCLTCSGGGPDNCSTCDSANHRTSSGGKCVCGNGYYEVGTTICQPCDGSCLTCNFNSTYCTSCLNAPGRFQAGNTCLCSSGYVDVLFNGTCLLCHYSCTACSDTTSSSCTACSNRTLSAGQCLCPSSSYDAGSATCQPCHSTCLNCSSALSSDCSACNSVYLRVLEAAAPSKCICLPGYYDSGSLICSACSSKCLTCQGSTSNCTSCNATLLRSISFGGICKCLDAYYDQLSLAACQPCSSTCLKCEGTSTNCSACQADRYLTASNVCFCLNGTFQNASGLCQACDYSCLTCSGSPTNCLNCPSGANRVQSGSSCPCLPGFYDNSAIICLSCPYSCSNCTASGCTSCPAGSGRALLSGSCSCQTGYYDDGATPTCLLCFLNCLTCSFYSQCLTCNATMNRIWDNITLTCPCTSGHYDDGHPLCQPCHYSCLTCSGGTAGDCLTCKAFRVMTTPSSCPCQTGTFEIMETCVSCSLSCQTCAFASTNCSSCATGSFLSSHQCLCNPGYFRNGLACDVCDGSCQTCELTSTTCLSCNPAQGTVLAGSACLCPDGKYKIASGTCQSCNYSCGTCSTGGSTCLSCPAGSYRLLSGGQCTCMSGYYDPGSTVCSICLSPCLACKGGSVLNCTSCISGYTLIGSFCRAPVSCPKYIFMGECVSVCPNVSYPLGSSCISCPGNCLTCVSSTSCSSCLTPFVLNSNGSCSGSCPSGTYQSGGQCLNCPQHCTSCATQSSQIVCIDCDPAYYFSNNVCQEGCPSGTHVLLEDKCISCLSPCKTCSALTVSDCLTCQSGYIYSNGRCLSHCLDGYFLINSNCMPCPERCRTCQRNVCLSCHNNYYLSPGGSCISFGYYVEAEEQRQCHPNCKTCTDSSFSSCIACTSYRGDSSSMAISGYCDCWRGSVDLGDGTCDVTSYDALERSNEALVSGSSAVTYGTVLAGVLSLNPAGCVLALFYQQSYGNFYYLNSSAVGQTEKVLKRYSECSPVTFLHSPRGGSEADFGRRLASFTNLQEIQSLFMRGDQWEYLCQWALVILILIVFVWIFGWFSACVAQRSKKKTCVQAFTLIRSILLQSALILIHLLTINEVTLYGLASFKIIIAGSGQDLDYFKLVLSAGLMGYYLIYLVKLIVVALRFKDTNTEDVERYKLLFAGFEISKHKFALSRIYLPLLMLSSMLTSLFLVVLSWDSRYQMASSLSLFFLWCLYSFCYCPYPFYLRLFIRIYELFYFLQLSTLTISVFKPEYSRMGSAIALLVLNCLQMVNLAGLSISILLYAINGKKCCNRQQNVVAPEQSLRHVSKGDPSSFGKSKIYETHQQISEEIQNSHKISKIHKNSDRLKTSHRSKGSERSRKDLSYSNRSKEISYDSGKIRDETMISTGNLAAIEEVSGTGEVDNTRQLYSRTDGIQEITRKRYRVRKHRLEREQEI